MIKIENVVLPSPEQWEATIRGMRNPKNSWDRMDSEPGCEKVTGSHELCRECDDRVWIQGKPICGNGYVDYVLGYNDHKLMDNLNAGGPVHAKYRRMIPVYLDITAPLYWWKEMDTYKIGVTANSCSTMHKIHAKEFTLDDFSHEHLIVAPKLPLVDELKDHLDIEEKYTLENHLLSTGEHDLLEVEFGDTIEYHGPFDILEQYIISALNLYRDLYLKTKDKKYWWQMIQLLPSSYNQKRTVMLNYEVLVGIYRWRKDHKLDEWREFCEWIESLPYSELITGKDAE